MELCVDEKWKLSKKGSRREGGPSLKAPASMREERRRSSATRAETGSFSSRCARLVKEQRARFYIMRRCVTMLVCWRDYP